MGLFALLLALTSMLPSCCGGLPLEEALAGVECLRALPPLDAQCAGACFPELLGMPCDGRSSGCVPPLAAAAVAAVECNCSWGPAVQRLATACQQARAPHAVPVFSAGDAGVSCFRIPAVVQTSRGALLAFAEARHGGCGDANVHELAMKRSTDGGRTWSKATFVVGSAARPVGNPYPIALSSGRVVLLYVKWGSGAPVIGSGVGLIASDDDGLSWGPEDDVSQSFGAANGSSPGPGAGVEIQVREGGRRLLVVLHHGAYVKDYVSYSDDGGVSWHAIERTFPEMDEATMADLGGGHVLLNMRHLKENTLGRAVARSTDGGLTWGDVSFDKALIGPVCQGSLAAINGAVFFSNPASARQRSHLTVRRSDDGGNTWPSQVLIQEGGSAGYSSLVRGALGDGSRGGILYESSSPGGIDFATFALDMAGPAWLI